MQTCGFVRKHMSGSCVSFVWFLKPSWPLSLNNSSLIRLFWKTKISRHRAKVLNFTNRLSLFSVALRKIGDALHIWYELDWLDIYVALSPLLTVITFDWTFGPFAPGIKVRFRWSGPNRIAFDHIEYTLWSDHRNHILNMIRDSYNYATITRTSVAKALFVFSSSVLWLLVLNYSVLRCGFTIWSPNLMNNIPWIVPLHYTLNLLFLCPNPHSRPVCFCVGALKLYFPSFSSFLIPITILYCGSV